MFLTIKILSNYILRFVSPVDILFLMIIPAPIIHFCINTYELTKACKMADDDVAIKAPSNYLLPCYVFWDTDSSKRYVSQMENPKMSLCENALVRKFMFRKFKTTFKIESNTWQILFCCIGFAEKIFFYQFS